jgi:hypothetical protein
MSKCTFSVLATALTEALELCLGKFTLGELGIALLQHYLKAPQ